MPPILALDLDGTLLNSSKEITPRTLSALLRLQEQGATVVIASGRPPRGSAPFARELQLRQHGGYIVAFNGALILECRTGKILYEKTLSTEQLADVYALERPPKCTILTYANQGILTEDGSSPHVQYASHINGLPVCETENLLRAADCPVHKCIIAGPPDVLDAVEQTARRHSPALPLTIVRSEPFFLEFMPQGVDKGAALARLLSITGHGRRELTAFGDSYNDASMLALAGTAVAMQNARPEIRAMAHAVTASNDEDGVALYLESRAGSMPLPRGKKRV